MKTNLLCIDTHVLHRDVDAETYMEHPVAPLPAVMVGLDGNRYAPVENTLAYTVPLDDLCWDADAQVVRQRTEAERDAEDQARIAAAAAAAAAQVAEQTAQDESARLPRLWEQLRVARNKKLTSCDWTQLSDAPITAEQVEAWRLYRQALRDLPQTVTDPTQVQWPTPPVQ